MFKIDAHIQNKHIPQVIADFRCSGINPAICDRKPQTDKIKNIHPSRNTANKATSYFTLPVPWKPTTLYVM